MQKRENRRYRLRLSSAREVKRSLTRIANMVINGEIETKQANAAIYGCNSVLNAIRIDEQQQRLDELERIIREEVRKEKLR